MTKMMMRKQMIMILRNMTETCKASVSHRRRAAGSHTDAAHTCDQQWVGGEIIGTDCGEGASETVPAYEQADASWFRELELIGCLRRNEGRLWVEL